MARREAKKTGRTRSRSGAEAAVALSVPELIIAKRDGRELDAGNLRALINAYAAGHVPDYQMSAFAMAVLFRGMSEAETTALTLAMRDSGRVVQHRGVRRPVVDKHSTGGVGDKVSICLAPLVSACGVAVPMMSGRGLGHTGGTLDKLESIAGFRVDLGVRVFERQLAKLGCVMIGQTHDLAPADRKLYALRDVTGTVESIPLITASILSKKLAEGTQGLVLDVKVGRGAFMHTVADARALAKSLVRVGTRAGIKVSALLTAMDAPLGYMIGNALETYEAIALLHGEAADDLLECTLALGAEMLQVAGVERNQAKAWRRLERALLTGEGLHQLRRIVAAQGGDVRVVDEPDRLPRATRIAPVRAQQAGIVQTINAYDVGMAAIHLGAGRTRVEDSIDPRAGIVLECKPGDEVQRGGVLAWIHTTPTFDTAPVERTIRAAFAVAQRPFKPTPVILERITG